VVWISLHVFENYCNWKKIVLTLCDDLIGHTSSGISNQIKDIQSIGMHCWNVAIFHWKVHKMKYLLSYFFCIFVHILHICDCIHSLTYIYMYIHNAMLCICHSGEPYIWIHTSFFFISLPISWKSYIHCFIISYMIWRW
jgi:hypothetical protein